jgi:hypothetical protein
MRGTGFPKAARNQLPEQALRQANAALFFFLLLKL